MNQFSTEFTNNGIDFSYILNGTHTHKNLENLDSWLNIKLLTSKIDLKKDEAYILGFKGIKTIGSKNRAISINLEDRSIALPENCSMLLANNELFKYSILAQDSVVKIHNNTIDGYIDIVTDGIDNVSTTNRKLKEDLSFGFAQFSIELNELKSDDIDLTLNTTRVFFSKNIMETKEKATTPKDDRAKEEEKTQNDPIGTDSDKNQNSSRQINLKNSYLVNLKKFVTPHEDELEEVHYHLVKMNKQLILVGGSKIDKKEKPIAKIVANMQDATIEVTNTSAQPIAFSLLNDKIVYKIRKSTSNSKKDDIATDRKEEPEDISEVSLEKGESHTFDKRIEFTNSAIEFTDDGVAIEYIKFTIGSFNHKLEFNRLYYTHFGRGNIIDGTNELDFGGRVFADKTKGILGSILSRSPFLLSVRDENINLKNSTNENFSITLKVPSKEQSLSHQEELNISKDALFSQAFNLFTINKYDTAIVEFEIIAN